MTLLNRIARFLGCLVAFLAVILPVRGQDLMRTRTYSIRDGLPSNYVSQIAQDQRGVIWISTWNGLASYDGYRFVNFRDRGGILASNRIYWIEPAGDGCIWLLTYDKRPFMLDSRTGSYYDIGKIIDIGAPARAISARDGVAWIIGDSLAVRVAPTVRAADSRGGSTLDCKVDSVRARVRHLMYDSDGCEWLSTDKGYMRYGTDLNIFDTFVGLAELPDEIYHLTKRGDIYAGHQPRKLATIPGVKAAKSIQAYGKNILLCATEAGVYAYNTASKRLTRLSEPTEEAPELHVDGAGRIWAIYTDGRVAMARSASDKFEDIPFVDDAGASTVFDKNIWIEDTYGRVWIAPKEHAIGYFDEERGVICNHPVRSHLLNNSVIPRVEVSYVDRQNNLWLSSMHNATLVNFTNSNLKSMPLQDNQPTRSVAVGADGTVWAGTGDGTLGVYAPDGTLRGYMAIGQDGMARLSASPRDKFAIRIYALKADSYGNMWVGTKGQGLYRIAPDGRVTHMTHDPADARSLPDDNIYDLDIDPAGNLWVATYGGGPAMMAAGDINAERPAFVSRTSGFSIPDGDKFAKVRRITHTPAGVMVASTTGGLLTFDSRFTDPAKVRFYRSEHVPGDERSLSSSHVMCAVATGDGEVYVAPLGDRISRVADTDLLRDGLHFEPLSDGALHPFIDEPSRAGNVVSMAEGPDGSVYIVLESCVVMYSPRDHTAMSLGYNDYDRTIEFTEAKAVVDADGRLWAPTANGVMQVDGTRAAPANYVPDIVVSGINGVEGAGGVSINPRSIVLPAGERSISLSFAALDYSNNELVQYAYRLDNDADWTYIGNTNTLNLAGLTPGTHRLQVRSTNGDGMWVDNVCEVEIRVTPRFWESMAGRLIMLFIACAIVAVIYIMYKRHRRTKAEHQKMHDFLIGYVDDKGRTQGGHGSLSNKATSSVTSPQNDSSAADGQSENATDADADRRMLSKLTEYIEAHLSNENLKVEDMAEAVGMGRTAFYNRLKALVDMTPADFVRRLRIQRAQALLREGRLTVSEIAYAVGYADPKYFTRIFKKETGRTPSECRTDTSATELPSTAPD